MPRYNPGHFGDLAEEAVIPVYVVRYLALNDTQPISMFTKRGGSDDRNRAFDIAAKLSVDILG